jgi:hypothetical protein
LFSGGRIQIRAASKVFDAIQPPGQAANRSILKSLAFHAISPMPCLLRIASRMILSIIEPIDQQLINSPDRANLPASDISAHAGSNRAHRQT